MPAGAALPPPPAVSSALPAGEVAPPIATSVGADAINDPRDVFVIQALLDQRLPKPHAPIEATGVIDPGTILAIEAYQAVVMHLQPPTGRVEPGSATYLSLAASESTGGVTITSHFGHVGIVPPEILNAAVLSRQHWRVPASVSLAQWAVESAWGAAMPPGSNNPFGIKALAGQDGVDSGTTEFVAGQPVTMRARFRRFPSLDDAFDVHGKLLGTGTPYIPAMQLVADPEAFANALTGVYATDPKYGYTLTWVMDHYGFRKFDQ